MPEFNKSKYDQDYQRKNIVTKRVPYNKQSQTDLEQLDWVEGKNYTQYVKQLIDEDMRREKHGDRGQSQPDERT